MYPSAPRSAPSSVLAWVTVFVLVIAYAVSFIDRQVVGLLVEPMKADLKITDTQIGVLQGPAFGLFYTVLGLPLGWLADRTHRIRLIAAGIFLWSGMTMACGLAHSFAGLFFARLGVGIGEAALVPAAVSLLADLFSASRRALPLSVFTAGVSLGTGSALMMGGAFIRFAHHGAEGLPLIGLWLAGRRVWQTVFILAGLIGVPVALAVLLLAEPARQPSADADDGDQRPRASLMSLGGQWRLLGPMFAGSAMIYIFTNALAAWIPSLFIRGFHWPASIVGVRLGLIIMTCAVLGNLASGLIANRLAAWGRADAPLLTMLLGAGLLAPAAILGPLAPSAAMAVVGVVALYFSISLCFGVATATFVAITPGPLRGQVVALYLLFGNLLGLGLGPLSVGAILDHLLHHTGQVGLALALVGAVSVAPGFVLLRSVRRSYAARAASLGA